MHTKKNVWVCSQCGEEVGEDGRATGWGENDAVEFTRDGNLVCWGCYENAESYATTLITFNPDGTKSKICFDADFNFYETDNDGDIYGCEENDWPSPVCGLGWHATDGWRGYTTVEVEEGYEIVENGWATGWPDETTERKADLNEFLDRMAHGERVPPCPVYVVVSITSNVFSQGVDVVVASEDRETFDRWLEREGAQLHEWLG